jgi:CHASE3 domain sensor protein
MRGRMKGFTNLLYFWSYGTKNTLNTSVENTNHYIPNVIIITIIILFLKYLYADEMYKNILKKILMIFLISCITIYIACSIVVYYSSKSSNTTNNLFVS